MTNARLGEILASGLLLILGLLSPMLAYTEPRTLDFDTAVQRTLHQSLQLNAAYDDAQAMLGQRKQASLYPNPIFSYEAENIGAANKWDCWANRDENVQVTQLVITAGKLDKRYKAASYQYYASLTGYQASKLDVLNRLSKSFVAVAAAQELLQIARDQKHIAFEILRIAQEKVEAGKVSLIQQSKAEVAYGTTALDLERTEAEFRMAKNSLALLWAAACPDFDNVAYPFYDIHPPVPLEECLTDLCNQPEVVQSLYQYYAAEQKYRLEKSNRIPDVALTLGYSYEDGDRGFVAGVSFPIPLLDRNQGNIKTAQAEMLKTGELGKQLWLILQTKLSNSHIELVRAYREVAKYRDTVLKSAQQAFELAEEGYREGKFEYLDVLDAQQTLFDVRERYILALVNFHNRRADIDYLNSQTD